MGLLIIFADQLSKAWIRANLAIGQSIFEVGFFRITHLNNTGAAFGLFQNHTLVLTIIGIIGAIAILFCAFLSRRYLPYVDNMPGKLALGLVFGGTIGNLIDRLRLGRVTDFIDVGFWPTFNVADSAVTVGVILLAVTILLVARPEKR